MKKLLVVCITSMCLLAVVFLGFIQAAQSEVIKLVDVQGNRAYLNAISYQASFLVNDHRLAVKVENGKVLSNTQLTDHGYSGDFMPIFASENDDNATIRYVQEKGEIVNDDLFEMERPQDCFKDEKIDQVYVQYYASTIYSFVNSDSLSTQLPTPLTIDTGLIEKSNDVQRFQKRTDTCEESEEVGYQRKLKDENGKDGTYFLQNQESQVTYFRALSKKIYYFLPKTTAFTQGDVYLYKITRKNSQENPKVQELEKMKAGRIYEDLRIQDHYLYVFSHDEQQLFITQYDQNGNWVNEVAIPYVYEEKDLFTTIAMSDEYIILTDGKKMHILDTKELEEVMTIPRYTKEIYDVMYKDGTLYLSSSGSMPYSIALLVLQEDKVLYEGELSFPKEFHLDEIRNEKSYNTGIENYGSFQ